jgi:hypothetical protein
MANNEEDKPDDTVMAVEAPAAEEAEDEKAKGGSTAEKPIKEESKTETEKAPASEVQEAEEPAATDLAVEPVVEEEDTANAIWEPAHPDVLSGRGASVNAHKGNKKFRALCFARKPEFEAGNHAAKRRIATEIVNATFDHGNARFLKKKNDKGPWYEMTKEQAILKACQVCS